MKTPNKEAEVPHGCSSFSRRKSPFGCRKIFGVLDGKTDYNSFELQLKKELDGLGCDLLKFVLETLEQKIEESEERKLNWKRIRKNDRKAISTLLAR